MFEEAKQKFLNRLQGAGIIHPHTGQDKLVADALELFLEDCDQERIHGQAEPEDDHLADLARAVTSFASEEAAAEEPASEEPAEEPAAEEPAAAEVSQ